MADQMHLFHAKKCRPVKRWKIYQRLLDLKLMSINVLFMSSRVLKKNPSGWNQRVKLYFGDGDIHVPRQRGWLGVGCAPLVLLCNFV